MAEQRPVDFTDVVEGMLPLEDTRQGARGAEQRRRLLAAEIAQTCGVVVAAVRADAWDEGHQRGYRDGSLDIEPADNPYRKEADHG